MPNPQSVHNVTHNDKIRKTQPNNFRLRGEIGRDSSWCLTKNHLAGVIIDKYSGKECSRNRIVTRKPFNIFDRIVLNVFFCVLVIVTSTSELLMTSPCRQRFNLNHFWFNSKPNVNLFIHWNGDLKLFYINAFVINFFLLFSNYNYAVSSITKIRVSVQTV